MSKKISLIVIFIIIIIISMKLDIRKNSKFSRNSVKNLIKNSNITNNIYIENYIYEGDIYVGLAKFYIKDTVEYIYQENKNLEKIETYINNENNISTTILHSEKIIIQNKYSNHNFELPLKNDLLNKLNNIEKYQYYSYGNKNINKISCIKISLINNTNNEKCNYYIDENTGYIIQYENETSNNKELYMYTLNTVTNEQIKIFNIDTYKDYKLIDSITKEEPKF